MSGTATVYTLAEKYGIKTAFGTDILFSEELAERQGAMLAALSRWYTPTGALIMATSTNAELLTLSGRARRRRSPSAPPPSIPSAAS
ncbi:hypothetical protein O0S08_29415 [Nannocystis poenicansa]|uniref:Uncharacterized protein n=1 Tax=Nannocystis punicea TaxID=2995304 RepID=A0ABY7GTN9_9BACT|nr:hypothetical protein [Nannocystis poenicansa]WAS90328.1 hypothetical protein O0S08_29415 [Nannocystis poenicansa]